MVWAWSFKYTLCIWVHAEQGKKMKRDDGNRHPTVVYTYLPTILYIFIISYVRCDYKKQLLLVSSSSVVRNRTHINFSPSFVFCSLFHFIFLLVYFGLVLLSYVLLCILLHFDFLILVLVNCVSAPVLAIFAHDVNVFVCFSIYDIFFLYFHLPFYHNNKWHIHRPQIGKLWWR